MSAQSNEPVQQAVAFLDAVLSSASTDTISPKEWWPRAAAALEASASAADDFGQMAAKAAKKMQIDSYKESSSIVIAQLAGELTGDAWEDFRSLCQRDAIYITALARADRVAARAAKSEEKS